MAVIVCGTWPNVCSRARAAVPVAKARRIRDERRLRSLGIARARAVETQIEPLDVDEVGEPAVVDGVRGTWRVDPAQLGQPFSGRAALLSPLDRLIYDRKRMTEIFEYDYQLEMYKPAAKRRWGYWALAHPLRRPAGRKARRHRRSQGRSAPRRRDPPGRTVHQGDDQRVRREIDDLASWLKLALDVPRI